ncbi:MAG: hypothetical protein ACPG1A_00955 [Halioglobus sp.]
MFDNALKKTVILFTVCLMALMLTAQAHAGRNCGGLNEKSCWHVDPKKWCDGNLQYKPTGVPGQGRCVKRTSKPKPKQKCGGVNQKSCWHVDPKKWCKAGLEYAGTGKPGDGRCIKPGSDYNKKCGGLGQASCWNANPARWCDSGLQYVGNGKPGDGRCVKKGSDTTPNCGGIGQKSCWNANPAKWCDKGLEYFGSGKPGDGRCIKPGSDPTPNCGGLRQASCWNVNPAMWCDGGLEYFGSGKPGEGRCITPGSDPTPNCGGNGQSSCWNPNPKHWCDDGMTYSPGVIPNEGTCYRKYSKEEYLNAARGMYETIDKLGRQNPVFKLRSCLLKPENLEQLQSAMGSRSENSIDRLLSACGVSPKALQDYGRTVLGYAPRTLEIGLAGGAVAGVGIEGSISYAIPLQSRPDGRYFLTNGLGGGAGAAVGADVTVSLTGDTMPTEHWISEKGRSMNFSGKALASFSISIDFPERDITPSGFTIGAGLGVGAEIGTLIYTRDQYLYNF